MLSIEKIRAKTDPKKRIKQKKPIKEHKKGKILRAQSSYLLFHLCKCPSGSQ